MEWRSSLNIYSIENITDRSIPALRDLMPLPHLNFNDGDDYDEVADDDDEDSSISSIMIERIFFDKLSYCLPLPHSIGMVYKGKLKNGKKYDWCTAIFPNGGIYESFYKNGKIYRENTFVYINGDTYAEIWMIGELPLYNILISDDETKQQDKIDLLNYLGIM